MSTATLIIGESGSGKSTSLRNFNKDEVLLIQLIEKRLPFKNDWKTVRDKGNIVVTKDYAEIVASMEKTKRKVIVIDDFQYLTTHEAMERCMEKGYEKHTEMASHLFNTLLASTKLSDADKRVYFLSHSEQSDNNSVIRFKVNSKMIDKYVGSVEGIFTIVLRSVCQDGKFFFSTRNYGIDTVKAPIGMFNEDNPLVENDLKAIDTRICEFYNIGKGEQHHDKA